MKHSSVKMNTPMEFINVEPLNPLISKCQIKVCYVGEDPNRNGSVITKEVARKMANSLPGSPIVGYYNETKEDFEGHNRIIDISNGEFKIKDTTKPYGFVGNEAWFQKFLDDGSIEREYLVTIGYLWTGQYPECKRILIQGNNHSMELDEDHLNAHWSENENGGPQFFIINEAIISKLCILGEDVEPCFEGSNITSIQFSFNEDFSNRLFSMMNELKELLQEGGAKQVFKRYSVTVGDSLWTALYELANGDSIIEVCEEDEGQKFAVLQNSDGKFYRIDFSFSDEDGLTETKEPTDLVDYSLPETLQFIQEDILEYEKKKKEDEEKDKKSKEDTSKSEEETEEDEDDNDDGEEEDEKKKKKKYSLDDIPEYAELLSKYSELETNYNSLLTEKETLESQLTELNKFKLEAERKDKEELIAQFYMLNDEDKKDVVDNIDTYSLDEIEAKLSVICVRNKVSFDKPDENDSTKDMTFNLNDADEDDNIPAWVKAVLEVEKNMK